MNAELIKSQLSMRTVVERYGLQVNRGGYILCPFHQERTPSLKIYDEPGRGWHCFGCGSGGSVIDFVARLYQINYRQALLRIAADFGFSDDPPDHDVELRFKVAQAKRLQEERRRQAELNGLAAEHCRLRRTIVDGEDWARFVISLDLTPPENWCRALDRIGYINYKLEAVIECQK